MKTKILFVTIFFLISLSGCAAMDTGHTLSIESRIPRFMMSGSESAGMGLIVGTVFEDLNGNGKLDAGEPPVPGVEVLLSRRGVEKCFTDINGEYLFGYPIALTPGTYMLGIGLVIPAGFESPDYMPKEARLHSGKHPTCHVNFPLVRVPVAEN